VVELGHDSSCPSIADHVLDDMSSLFDEMYAETGRPSVPPERLLKSMVLMALYTIRSERQFCEQLDYNLLFRWFLAHEHGRGQLRCEHVLEEPGAADGSRGGVRVLSQRCGEGA
jgi:hypothetical protein